MHARAASANLRAGSIVGNEKKAGMVSYALVAFLGCSHKREQTQTACRKMLRTTDRDVGAMVFRPGDGSKLKGVRPTGPL